MARSIYSDKLRNRTNRLKLPIRKKPYKLLIAPGIFLCYRRNAGPGTWSVEAVWLKRFAIADDHEGANNASVLSFHQAQAKALKLVMLLTETELLNWRNGLVVEGLKLSSANLIGKSFKAALALAAKRDKRIINSAAWQNGLKPLKAKGHNNTP